MLRFILIELFLLHECAFTSCIAFTANRYVNNTIDIASIFHFSLEYRMLKTYKYLKKNKIHAMIK